MGFFFQCEIRLKSSSLDHHWNQYKTNCETNKRIQTKAWVDIVISFELLCQIFGYISLILWVQLTETCRKAYSIHNQLLV